MGLLKAWRPVRPGPCRAELGGDRDKLGSRISPTRPGRPPAAQLSRPAARRAHWGVRHAPAPATMMHSRRVVPAPPGPALLPPPSARRRGGQALACRAQATAYQPPSRATAGNELVAPANLSCRTCKAVFFFASGLLKGRNVDRIRSACTPRSSQTPCSARTSGRWRRPRPRRCLPPSCRGSLPTPRLFRSIRFCSR